MNIIRDFQLNNIEYFALISMLLISLIFYYFKYFSYIFMIISLVIGIGLFILVNKFRYNKREYKPDNKSHLNGNLYRLDIIINLIFVASYGLSIASLLQIPYSKTVIYYLFLSLCADMIALEILITRSYKKVSNLLKSYILGLNVFLSNQILFPFGIGGSDSDYHLNKLIFPIIETGRVPLDTLYSYFPGHHILVSIFSIVLNTNPIKLYYISGGIVMSLGIPLVYILGQKFFNETIALFGSLLYPFNDFIILWASHPAQLTYTIPMIMIIFLIINIWLQNGRKKEFFIIIEILMLIIIFTHHYSSFIFLFLLLSILISEIEQNNEKRILYSPKLFILFIIMLFVHWIYYSYLFKTFLDLSQTYINVIFKIERIGPISYDSLPLKIIFLNTLGTSIILSLAIFGFLCFLKESPRPFFKNIIGSFVVICSVLIGIGVISNMPYLLPQRLFVFIYIFGVLFLAIYVIQKIRHIYLSLFLITAITFFSASSTISGFETSPFLGEQPYTKLYITSQEINSEKWIEHNKIGDDSIFKMSMSDYKLYTNNSFLDLPVKYNLSTKKYNPDFENITMNSYIIYSKFDSISGFPIVYGVGMGRGKMIKIDREFESEVDNIYNKNYYDGTISIYHSELGEKI